MYEENLTTLSDIRSILQEYLSVERMESFYEHILSTATLKQLEDQLIAMSQNNPKLYKSFRNFIYQRFESIDNLIQFISVDADNYKDETKMDPQADLTLKQFNLLIQKKKIFLSKLQSSLTTDFINQLLDSTDQRFVKPNDLNKGDGFKKDQLVQLFHKLLLLSNSKLLYKKFVNKCRNEAERYLTCFEWMNRSEFCEEKQDKLISNYDQVEELALLRTQLAEVRGAVLNLVGVFNEQMINLTSRLEQMKSNDQTDLLMLKVDRMHHEMTQRDILFKKKVVSIETRWLKFENENAHSQEEMKKQISSLEEQLNKTTEVETVDDVGNNELPSISTTEITLVEDLRYFGMPPLHANANGEYPKIDWTKLHPEFDYLKDWKQICLRNDALLDFPLLVLPPALGSWVVVLVLNWNNGLILFGALDSFHGNENSPASIMVHLYVKIKVKGIKPLVFDKMVELKKGIPNKNGSQTCDILGKFVDSVDESWPIPKVIVRVIV